jgi:hypothetical protein
MKISRLIQAEAGGVPFYTLKPGTYFEIIEFDSNGRVRRSSSRIFEMKPVLMKIDTVGALDWPYNQKENKSILFIHENTLVQVIKRSQKEYKNYVYGKELFHDDK